MGSTTWKPPPTGWWKVNTEAAIAERHVGLGMIVRDNIGDVLMSGGKKLDVAIQVLEEEVRATLFGLRYAYDAGFRQVELETDCLNLVTLLTKKSNENSTSQMVVKDIFVVVNLFEACIFKFPKRLCNMTTYSLAKDSLMFDEVLIWMEECPHRHCSYCR
ncbi:uncharacterized protein [Spinacia oleracea]|uniref:RNase H type-1 domain-containing protein n=1 Tax=Spinacia oleracea TaxID=3562 RepID=A0A9R0JDI8_SPIOL|nr:uncharacterized protein LOC110804283 [Spinacia oleracea]